MRIALDSNIVLYFHSIAVSERDQTKPASVWDLMLRIPEDVLVVPAQVLGECVRVMQGKAKMKATEAVMLTSSWRAIATIAPTTETALFGAMDLIGRHGLQVWDSVILAVAAESGCRVLLSEDYQHGFTWGGVTVLNPFVEPMHPLLTGLAG